MRPVKVVNERGRDPLQSLTKYLTISLGVLVALIILISYNNPSITGYSVFTGIYGSASPFVIVGLLVVIIFLYHKLNKE